MKNIKDENGHNQIFAQTNATLIRLERRSDWMINEMDQVNAGDILEIGCGTGRMSYLMADKTHHQVLGADISLSFIGQAKENYSLPNLSYMYLDFTEPSVLNGKKFDYIVGNGILHHLYYGLDDALLKIKDLLKDGGKMIFMEPNIYNPYCALIFKIPFFSRLAHLEPDEMAFSKSFITKKLQKAGFKKNEVDYKDFLLPGIPEALIKPSIVLGDFAEKIPLVRAVSQSLFIVGVK